MKHPTMTSETLRNFVLVVVCTLGMSAAAYGIAGQVYHALKTKSTRIPYTVEYTVTGFDKNGAVWHKQGWSGAYRSDGSFVRADYQIYPALSVDSRVIEVVDIPTKRRTEIDMASRAILTYPINPNERDDFTNFPRNPTMEDLFPGQRILSTAPGQVVFGFPTILVKMTGSEQTDPGTYQETDLVPSMDYAPLGRRHFNVGKLTTTVEVTRFMPGEPNPELFRVDYPFAKVKKKTEFESGRAKATGARVDLKHFEHVDRWIEQSESQP